METVRELAQATLRPCLRPARPQQERPREEAITELSRSVSSRRRESPQPLTNLTSFALDCFLKDTLRSVKLLSFNYMLLYMLNAGG